MNRPVRVIVGISGASGAAIAARLDGKAGLLEIRGIPLDRAPAALRAVATALR